MAKLEQLWQSVGQFEQNFALRLNEEMVELQAEGSMHWLSCKWKVRLAEGLAALTLHWSHEEVFWQARHPAMHELQKGTATPVAVLLKAKEW